MDVRVEFADKEIGTIPYESIPALFLLLRENSIPFNWDEENRKIQLQLGLTDKTIIIMKETLNQPYSHEKVNKVFIDGVHNFLKSCGASVYRKENLQPNVRTDLRIVLAMQEDPTINRPKMEVFHDMKMINQKWPFLLKEECKQAGIEFSSHINPAETEPYMKFLMMVPKSLQSLLQKKAAEKFQMIISMGILSRLQANYPLFLLSYLPFNKISFFHQPIINSNVAKSVEESKLEKNVSTISESTVSKQEPITARDYLSALNKKNDLKNFDAEVFFDYQVIFDRSRNEKIMLFGNFFIKNTGGAVLRNPVICFRTTPKGNINFSGQLVPPNVAETLGVEKGWKYMFNDWFQQIEEKGEIWVCPIKSMEILPGQTESFQNFRINLHKDENQQNLKVEGFVFFQKQGLEYKANNSISLSF